MTIETIRITYENCEDNDGKPYSPKLNNQDVAYPCDSVYTPGYLILPNEHRWYFSVETQNTLDSGPALVAVPLSSPFAPDESVFPERDRGVYCRRFYKESNGSQVVVFISGEEPDQWIGFVNLSGSLNVNGQRAGIEVTHNFTYVNPKYRGDYFGSLICAMSGFLISEYLFDRLHVTDERELPVFRDISLEVTGEPTHQYGEYLIRSLSEGVNFLLRGLSDSFLLDEQDEAINYIYYPPVIEW